MQILEKKVWAGKLTRKMTNKHSVNEPYVFDELKSRYPRELDLIRHLESEF